MHHAATLVDLAKTPEEVKKDMPLTSAESDAGAEKPSVPVYPWGTCIRLEDDELKKMGMSGDMPPAGAIVHGCFVGRVKASTPPSERIDSDGKKTVSGACVEIEMQQLGFAAEDDVERQIEDSGRRQRTWYGEPDGDEGEPDGDEPARA